MAEQTGIITAGTATERGGRTLEQTSLERILERLLGMPPEDYYRLALSKEPPKSIAQMARELQISEKTVRNHMKRHKLPWRKEDRKVA